MKRLLLVILLTMPQTARAQAAAADSAWKAGDTKRAAQLYSTILASDSSDDAALHRFALLQAWENKFDASLHLFDRLITLEPTNIDARIDRARVLSWKGDLGGAVAAMDSILASDPKNVGALQLKAQVLTWSNRYQAAQGVYDDLLRLNPNDVAALTGNAQGLRWQGREAEAYELLERALKAEPTNKDAREQMRWVRAVVDPHFRPNYTHESDSDGSDINTWNAAATYRPHPFWELRPEAYYRTANGRNTSGGGVGLARFLRGGWSGNVFAGVSQKFASWRAGIATPNSGPVTASVAYAQGALDATGPLIDNEVTTSELSGNVTLTSIANTNVSAGGSITQFKGHVSGESNQRTALSSSITRKLTPRFTVGVMARTFSFDKNLNDGYFDPDYFGNAELLGRLRWERKRVALNADFAPGLQKIGKDSETTGSLRGSARVSYSFGIGRSLEAFAVYANSGLNQLSQVSTSDYRYHAFGISSNWTF